jgi:hypothetical protein
MYLRDPKRVVMSCHSPVSEWTTLIHLDRPHLSKPQATVLTRSCALTVVAAFLAVWLPRQEQTVQQQLR